MDFRICEVMVISVENHGQQIPPDKTELVGPSIFVIREHWSCVIAHDQCSVPMSSQDVHLILRMVLR